VVQAARGFLAVISRATDTSGSAITITHGVHAVGVNEIAARARASKLSLYRYFPSKDELVEAMLREHSDRIHDWLIPSTADAPAGPDRVLSVFDFRRPENRAARWAPVRHGQNATNR
jgi:AcrR family transcriptional regulator